MNICIIAAVSDNWTIGRRQEIPWHVREDLEYFKNVTYRNPIVMGRKTFESIGKALPGRDNIVITSQLVYTAKGCTTVHSIEEALKVCEGYNNVFFIGGSDIYKQVLPRAHLLYLTRVHFNVAGEVKFPHVDFSQWHLIWKYDKESVLEQEIHMKCQLSFEIWESIHER